jgi:hypothetical protein
MQRGTLTANVSQTEIAATGDNEVKIAGTAVGQGDNVRVYLIGPRGRFLGADGTAGQSETLDVDDERFEQEYDAFDTRGEYTFIIVSRGRDGEYASDYGFGGVALQSDLTPQQAVAIVNDEYTGAGVDDQVVELTLQAETPSLTIDHFTTNGEIVPKEATITGTSNREDGTPIFVEVTDENQDVVASAEAEVNGTTSEWSTRINLSDAETGSYTLRVSDFQVSSHLEFEIVGSIETATRTLSGEQTETEATAVEPAEEPTETPTQEPVKETTSDPRDVSTTSASAVGFHITAVLVALLLITLSIVRRD